MKIEGAGAGCSKQQQARGAARGLMLKPGSCLLTRRGRLSSCAPPWFAAAAARPLSTPGVGRAPSAERERGRARASCACVSASPPGGLLAPAVLLGLGW